MTLRSLKMVLMSYDVTERHKLSCSTTCHPLKYRQNCTDFFSSINSTGHCGTIRNNFTIHCPIPHCLPLLSLLSLHVQIMASRAPSATIIGGIWCRCRRLISRKQEAAKFSAAHGTCSCGTNFAFCFPRPHLRFQQHIAGFLVGTHRGVVAAQSASRTRRRQQKEDGKK